VQGARTRLDSVPHVESLVSNRQRVDEEEVPRAEVKTVLSSSGSNGSRRGGEELRGLRLLGEGAQPT
jgi:hypothetical protein